MVHIWFIEQVRTILYGANYFAVWFNGTYVHYVYAYNSEPVYRRGIPESDGSITWSTTSEETITTSLTQERETYISVDSDGYPWITLYAWNGTHHNQYVYKSQYNNGSFSLDTGFPYKMVYGANYRASGVPLTNGKMYFVYFIFNQEGSGKLWNGTGWEDEETIGSATDDRIEQDEAYSVTSVGDDVHVVFLKRDDYDIKYINRTYGSGWGSSTTLQSSTTITSYPALSIDKSTGNLYVFWASDNYIYYKKYDNSTTNWDSSSTTWIDESTEGLTGNQRLISYHERYDSKLAVGYSTRSSSPYNIKHAVFVPGDSLTNSWS